MRIPKNQEEITKLVIKKIEAHMEILAMNSRLCVPVSACIAAEHDLHGTVADGIEKLRMFKNKLRKYLKTQQTVEAIRLMKVRKEHYNDQQSRDPYVIVATEAFIENDRRKMNVMLERSMLRDDDIHNRKECICYN